MLRTTSNLVRLTPNPRILSAPLAWRLVPEGVELTWSSDLAASAWRVFRADATEDEPPILLAELPAAARLFVDRSDAPSNRYRAGNRLIYSVVPVAP